MKFHEKSVDLLKLLFIIGLLFTFISLFLEWFFVEVRNESGQLLLESTHAILNGWDTIEYLESNLLNQYIPKITTISPMMSIIQVFLIAGSIIIALFRNPETVTNLETTKSNSYFFLTTIFMIIFMITVFPFTILFPNEFFFPGMVLENGDLSITIYQGIGIGYYFQCMGFILTFPYAFFCYKVATTFEQHSKIPNKSIQMQEVKESVNLDQLIAEEDAFMTTRKQEKGQEVVDDQIEIAYQQFQSQRKNSKRLKK
ncbi:MAG: hypothetical protein KGD73_05670 [Candidatus Lokiarchaeota archaeon]|nr:hypothetical protein [Candidatus Lokiarchaeota archaeon]